MNERMQSQSVGDNPPTTTTVSSGILRRKCDCGNHTMAGGECRECDNNREGALQRQAASSGPVSHVPPAVQEVLRSPGQPLGRATRAFMEPRFGHDFSQVRVHADAKAGESARRINALAYTAGRNVVFGAGQYAPGTKAGDTLLAHELTHVVQQEGSGVPGFQAQLDGPHFGDPLEHEADQMAHSVIGSDPPAKGKNFPGQPLGYREATELAKCISIMGEDNARYCREVVLGDKLPISSSKSPEANKSKPKKTLVTQPAQITIPRETAEAKPFEMTTKFGFEREKNKQEDSLSKIFEAMAEKEGVFSGSFSQGDKRTSEKIPGGPDESSHAVEYKVEATLPVGSWLFSEDQSKRLAPWVFLKELSAQGSFATKRPDDPTKMVTKTLAGELSANLIGVELKSKREQLGLDIGLSASVAAERARAGSDSTMAYELGTELKSDFTYRPGGGPVFIFATGSVRFSTTKDGGAAFSPGAFTFTVGGGIGIKLPIK